MAGELYRAKTRTGGLSTALAPIFEYFKQKKIEDEQKEYLKNLFGAYKNYKQRIEEIQTGFPKDRTIESNPLTPKVQPNVSIEEASQFNPDVEIPIDSMNRGNVLNQTRNTGVNALTPQQKENMANQEVNEFTVAQLFNPENQKYADPNKVSVLANVLRSQLPKKPEVMKLNKNDVLGTFDRDNNQFKELYRNEEQAKENALDKKIDEYTNSSNDKIVIFQRADGSTYEKKFGKVRETKNITNIENKLPQPEKWKGFGKTISDARRKFNSTKEGIEQLLPEEINKNWDDAKAEYKSTMLPQAKVWFENNIEKKGLTAISDKDYLTKIRDAVNKDQLTIEEAQDLIDANAYRSDLYGK